MLLLRKRLTVHPALKTTDLIVKDKHPEKHRFVERLAIPFVAGNTIDAEERLETLLNSENFRATATRAEHCPAGNGFVR
jgi:hypothetical protein